MRHLFAASAALVTAGVISGCSINDVQPGGFDVGTATLAIADVTVIDVTSGQAIASQTLFLSHDEILGYMPTSDAPDHPADAALMDGAGLFVMPGLWDMHVHALSDPDDAIDRVLPLFVAHGVTGVRDMGAVMAGLTETRSRIAADPGILAPAIIAAGPLLDGQALPWYGDLPLVLETPEAVPGELAQLREAGVDFFKVYGGLQPEVYDAIIAYAAQQDVPVAGHVPNAVGLFSVAEANQTTVEHLSPDAFRVCVAEPQAYFNRSVETRFGGDYDGYFQNLVDWFEEAETAPACAEAIAALAAADTYLTATLVMEVFNTGRIDSEALGFMPAQGQSWCQTNLDGVANADPALRETAYAGFFAFTRRLREAGVGLLAGSDMPNFCNVPGASLHWELQRLAEAGLPEAEILRMATMEAALVAGQGSQRGQIVPGYTADLVVLRANPLIDIAATEEIETVIQAGRRIDRAGLDRLLDEIAAGVASADTAQ
ncbi:amidohydrolase family protein [Maricaulis sp.]|uniref:amidohydrolase family protein n=1 Tax=Maricaulis sp. TaxID=1486257 RepID=UPI002611FB48|nr:amidohydrolase family protein [Maricaulis sp.]